MADLGGKYLVLQSSTGGLYERLINTVIFCASLMGKWA